MTGRPASTRTTTRTPVGTQPLATAQHRVHIGSAATRTWLMRLVVPWATVARLRTVRRSSCTIHLVSRQHCVKSGRLHPVHAVHCAPSCTSVPRHVCELLQSARQTTECLCLGTWWRSSSNLILRFHPFKAVRLTALKPIRIFSPRVPTPR